MKEVEIYFEDLTPEAQERVERKIDYNDNWLFMPLFILQCGKGWCENEVAKTEIA